MVPVSVILWPHSVQPGHPGVLGSQASSQWVGKIIHCSFYRPGQQVAHGPSAHRPSSRGWVHPIAKEAGTAVPLYAGRKDERFGKRLLSQKP